MRSQPLGSSAASCPLGNAVEGEAEETTTPRVIAQAEESHAAVTDHYRTSQPISRQIQIWQAQKRIDVNETVASDDITSVLTAVLLESHWHLTMSRLR